MGKTRKYILIAGLLLCAQVCFARQVSFQIIQHDERTEKVTEQSLVIEDELLSGFFESGYIVTNSPTVVSNSDANDIVVCYCICYNQVIHTLSKYKKQILMLEEYSFFLQLFLL